MAVAQEVARHCCFVCIAQLLKQTDHGGIGAHAAALDPARAVVEQELLYGIPSLGSVAVAPDPVLTDHDPDVGGAVSHVSVGRNGPNRVAAALHLPKAVIRFLERADIVPLGLVRVRSVALFGIGRDTLVG